LARQFGLQQAADNIVLCDCVVLTHAKEQHVLHIQRRLLGVIICLLATVLLIAHSGCTDLSGFVVHQNAHMDVMACAAGARALGKQCSLLLILHTTPQAAVNWLAHHPT
jgi:hypothetical protein